MRRLVVMPAAVLTGLTLSPWMAGCTSDRAIASDEVSLEARQEEAADVSQEIIQAVRDIRAQPTGGRRTDRAYLLERRVRRVVEVDKIQIVSDVAIDEIALLLNDPSTSMLACVMLAYFGPRAQGAVPAIESAITEMEVLQRDSGPMAYPVNAVAIMRNRLARIRGE